MESTEKLPANDVSRFQEDIHTLEATLDGEDPKKIVSQHIKLLQEYNEAKDKAQALIGRMATLKGVSIKQLHEEYGLDAED